MYDAVVVEVFDSLYDLSSVVDDCWLVVFQWSPFLSQQSREAACEGGIAGFDFFNTILVLVNPRGACSAGVTVVVLFDLALS